LEGRRRERREGRERRERWEKKLIPACNIPGVANKTMGPGLSMADCTKGFT
jgi:hypothetical protein